MCSWVGEDALEAGEGCDEPPAAQPEHLPKISTPEPPAHAQGLRHLQVSVRQCHGRSLGCRSGLDICVFQGGASQEP